MKEIAGFFGPYRFLSNFYPATVIYGGIEFPTVEHGYQAAKTSCFETRRKIATIGAPAKARWAGSSKGIIKDYNPEEWEIAKLIVMEKLLKQKFIQSKFYGLLQRTGKAELVELNTWGDTYWGVCARTGQGENNLGKLLMKIREDHRNKR